MQKTKQYFFHCNILANLAHFENQKRLLRERLVCLCLLASVHCAQATESDCPLGLSAGTIMVCQAEQAIGFHWVKGKWKSTDFIADSYIIEKRDIRATGKGSAGCQGMFTRANVISGNKEASMPGCYAIHRRGQDSHEVREQICTENMFKEGGKF